MPFNFDDLDPLMTQKQTTLPCVSIIIPAYNCAQRLSLTLDSIIDQKYPHCEIIVIDAGSTDRTIELLHTYDCQIQIHSANEYKIFPMLNQGIEMAKGDYINILFPGDFHIHPQTISHLMAFAQTHEYPELVYCSTLLRDDCSEPKTLFRNLDLELLKKGQQPASLQACWFKRELFNTLGKFCTHLHMRAGFDLLCRFFLNVNVYRFASINRTYVDFDLRGVTSEMVIRHFYETGRLVYSFFGKNAWAKWLLRQKDVKRFINLWFRRFALAFKNNA